ncbi:hypothetical protein ACFFU8_08945 [Chromobacterium piscinae]|uniref:hypothetical protein n=1 Tax=Chromobacterium piscinae TaxID=686831 RepID=UPI001E4627B2|nr:hypothetical protein [Chromobacterium piscinae]MCD5327970.1 hypothetical protein [Chromobacterium piscinae]
MPSVDPQAERRRAQFSKSQQKRRQDMLDAGFVQLPPLWIKPETRQKLNEIKEAYSFSHLGQCIDALAELHDD